MRCATCGNSLDRQFREVGPPQYLEELARALYRLADSVSGEGDLMSQYISLSHVAQAAQAARIEVAAWVTGGK